MKEQVLATIRSFRVCLRMPGQVELRGVKDASSLRPKELFYNNTTWLHKLRCVLESCSEFFEANQGDGFSQVVEKYRSGGLGEGEASDDLIDCG